MIDSMIKHIFFTAIFILSGTQNQGVYERLYVNLGGRNQQQDPGAVTSVPIQEQQSR